MQSKSHIIQPVFSPGLSHMGKARKHGVILVIAYLMTSLMNYAFSVGLSWYLTPNQFGVLGVAQSILLMVALIVGSGFSWTAAKDLASNGADELSRVRFRTAILANGLVGMIIALGLWLTYQLGWMPLGASYRLVIPMIGVTTLILCIRAVLNGAARGLLQFTAVAINLVGEVIVKIALGLSLVSLHMGVTGVMIAFAMGALASLLHSLWITRPAKLWSGRGWIKKEVITDTGPLFLAMLGPALMLNLDILGLKLLSPSELGDTLAGYYQAAVILARGPVFVAQALTLVMFSYAANHNSNQAVDYGANKQNEYLRTSFRVWFWLLLPAGLALILFPKIILSMFFPPQYLSAALTLQIGAAGGALLALVTLLNGVLQAIGEKRYSVLAAITATSAQVIALIFLIPRWGAVGAAFSLPVAGVIALVTLIPALRRWGPRSLDLYHPIQQISNR